MFKVFAIIHYEFRSIAGFFLIKIYNIIAKNLKIRFKIKFN